MADMDTRRFSERRGIRAPETSLYDGVPSHLHELLSDWVSRNFNDDEMTKAVLAHARLTPTVGYLPQYIVNLMHQDPDGFLDVVDTRLRGQIDPREVDRLDNILRVGGSLWTVRDDRRGLEESVTAAERDAYSDVLAPADLATSELQTAWTAAYGRSPDPSDAWDHAIKAAEAILWQIVSPQNQKATLGTMLGDLDSKPSKWATEIGDPEDFHRVLKTIWANPDRHATGVPTQPTLKQARAVVRTAVWIVGQVRDGAFRVK